MTDQERFETAAIGTTITGCEWLELYDDGEAVGRDRPLLIKLSLANGDAIEFDGYGEAYYARGNSRQNVESSYA